MEQLNNNVIGEFFEKLGILEENDRDEFFKKIDEKHKEFNTRFGFGSSS